MARESGGGIYPAAFLPKRSMKNDDLHVVQDEWSYSVTKTPARKKAKRARQKAKRQLSKKRLAQAVLNGISTD